MSEIDINHCPAYHLYNVFGTDDKGCCYLEHKYCDDVESCSWKKLIQKAKQYNCDAGQQLIRMSQELQQYKQLCEQKTVDNFDLMSHIDRLKAEKKELKKLNKANADNYVRWRDKIEAENEELKKQIAEDLCYEDKSKKCNKAFYIDEINKQRLKKAENCLDEIEEICHKNKEELNYLKDEYNFALVILQLIKQAKEGGE